MEQRIQQTQKTKITTILFDFDGTVMNTNELIIESWQHTYRTVEGKERPVDEIMRTFGEPLLTSMEKALPQIPPEEAVEIYRSYHLESFGEKITIFPGVKETLKALKAEGYKLAVVTSRAERTTFEAMEKYDIIDCFSAVVTCDDTTKHKPDPEPVMIALQKLGSTVEESLMVGDSMFDIGCARNAGVKSVLVGWAVAVTDEEKEGPMGPDFIIEEAAHLFDLL